MENTRNDLAEKLDVIGRVFEIDGMNALLAKFESGMPVVKFNAIMIQVSALLLKGNKALADSVISMALGKSTDEIQELDDGEYAAALRNALTTDVMGFFVSSPRSGGKK